MTFHSNFFYFAQLDTRDCSIIWVAHNTESNERPWIKCFSLQINAMNGRVSVSDMPTPDRICSIFPANTNPEKAVKLLHTMILLSKVEMK